VDLSQLAAVTLDSGYEGLYLCFWHERRPLGHRELLASELPLSEAQVRNLAVRSIAAAVHSYLGNSVSQGQLMLQLSEAWRGEEGSFARQDVSLVICTRDRPERLRRCLESVAALTFQPAEIIIVDNGIRREETRRVAEHFERVRYIVEPIPGLSRARNAGVRAASSPLVAFTDDDIVLSPDWLFHLVNALRDPSVAAASGLVFPAELRTEAQIAFEHQFGGFHQGYEPRSYGPQFLRRAGHKAPPVWSICAGGDMIVRRSTFDSVGLFDESLGAGAAGCSEDSEFWYRILANGGTCAYAPAAAVHHYHREDMESLGRQIFLYMRGHVAALLTQFARFHHWGNLHRIAAELPLHYAERWLRALVSREGTDLVLKESVRGSAAGIWYWIRHGRGKEDR
jgi:GT2 family glycosyltransferase